MASQHDADSSCDETTSSLGDSTYDFIDDRSTTTDEEEADRMTASTSSESFEADRPVVVPAALYTPPHTQVEADDTDLETPTCIKGQTDAPGPSKSMVEERSLADDPNDPIEFEEPSVINLNTSRMTEVSHTLRVIEEPHQVTGKLHDTIKTLSPGRINVTVRQAMTSHSMELKGKPFRILFSGNLSMKDPIIQKIGEALAANSRSSTPDFDDARPNKINVVPVSGFGDSRHPEVVLIDSSGLEMSIEDCTSAGSSSNPEERDSLSLRLADGSHVQSRRRGSKYVLSKDWILPDLAIFCVSEHEIDSEKRTRLLAEAFMFRHSVSALFIEKQATWNETILLSSDYMIPHICLEYQQPNKDNRVYMSRYPIDLATFLSIDAGQLNRNLACLTTSKRLGGTQADPRKDSVKSSDSVWYSDFVDTFLRISGRVTQEDVTSILPLVIGVLLFCVPLVLWGSFRSGSFAASPGLKPTDTSMPSVVTSMTPIATTQLSLSRSDALMGGSWSATPSQTSPLKSTSSNTDIASFLMDAYTLGPNKSDKFIIQVLGDRHIVVNSPRWLRTTRRAPALSFRVSRQNETIEHVLSTLGEGVFALQIPREEAIGSLNVSMIIHSKTVQREKFEVDFGSSWLKMAAWKRAACITSAQLRKDMSVIQSGLSIVYNETRTELSNFVQQTKAHFAEQRTAEQALLARHLQWGMQTGDFILGLTNEFSRRLSHRLQAGQKQASQQFQSLTKDVSRGLSIYIRSRTHTISHRAQRLARLFSYFKAETRGHAGDRLKTAQKKALRAWWKIVGVPKTSRLPRESHGRGQDQAREEGEDEGGLHGSFF